MAADPRFAGSRAARAFPGIGSYVAVPVVRSDGNFMGTLCAVDPDAHRLDRSGIELLTVLARLFATQVERDEEMAQRERAERVLRDRERRFRALIERSSDVVLVADDRFRPTYVGASVAGVLGLAPGDLGGQPLVDLVHPDDRPRLADAHARLLGGPGRAADLALRLRDTGGEWRWLEGLAVNRLDEPEVGGIVVNLRDATERRRLQEQRDRLLADLEEELVRAAQVQAELLPDAPPDLPGYAVAAACLPARRVGGDFFDWSEAAGSVRLTLGDVMGKGMAAALLMATARAALRSVAHLPLGEAVAAVNRALSPDLARSDGFVTLFHAQLEAASGDLAFVDAGHGLALVRRRDGRVDVLRHHGLPLGILPEATYGVGATRIGPGDALLVYSDGLPDANPAVVLDPETIGAAMAETTDARATIDRLVALADPGGARPDDLTLLLVARDGEGA